jgi:hypothetical protein
MTPLPLSSQTLAWLNHAADAGQRDAQVLLHLIARADAQDQWFAKFTDSYSRTIAALCRRLEALERGANDLTAAPDPVEPEIEVCETCDGEGTIDERLGGISTSNPAATCPDCDGVGEPRRFHRHPPAGPVPAPEADPSHIDQLAAIIRRVDGNNSMGAAALAEAILERYPLAFLVDQRLTSPACLVIDCLPEGLLDLLKSEPGRNKACTAVVSIEPLRDAPGPTFQDAIRLAEGCHDYSGGHSGTEGEAWHGAIGTVVAVLKRAAVGPWDSQTMVVYGVGAEAGVGEVAVSEPVSECPHCGYEGEMVPAPQPGEVEA